MNHFAMPPDRTPNLVAMAMSVFGLLMLGVWFVLSDDGSKPFVPEQPCAGGQPVGLMCQSSGLLYHCRQYRVVYWCPQKDSK